MGSCLHSEVAKIPAKISILEVLQPQVHPKRGWGAVHSHLPFLPMSQRRSKHSEVAKIPAKISNLEVLQPQGHPQRGWRAVNSHLPFLPISQRRSDSLHHVWNRREDHHSRVF